MAEVCPYCGQVLPGGGLRFDHEAFRRERVARGISLHEMEQLTGLRPVVVSGIERGVFLVSQDDVYRLAQALDVEPGELLKECE